MTNLYGKVYDAQRDVWGFPFMTDSGTFWRCRHGKTQFKLCCRCGIFHPLRFVRAVFGSLS